MKFIGTVPRRPFTPARIPAKLSPAQPAEKNRNRNPDLCAPDAAAWWIWWSSLAIDQGRKGPCLGGQGPKILAQLLRIPTHMALARKWDFKEGGVLAQR